MGLAPLLLQDDSLQLSTTIEGAREVCQIFEDIMDSKALEVNISKSTYLLMGKKKNIEMIRKEIAKDPLCYKQSIVKEKSSEKWLGTVINSAGIKESAFSTINERYFRVMNGIHEIASIIEDSRLDRLGSLKCAKEIWELALVPVLLNSVGVWPVLSPNLFKTLKRC